MNKIKETFLFIKENQLLSAYALIVMTLAIYRLIDFLGEQL